MILQTLNLISFIITGLAFISIVLAVVIDFLENHSNRNTKKEKKSFIETGTMFLFFLFFYLAIRFRIGTFQINNNYILIPITILCWIVILIGIYFNIKGRFLLGKNWANQVKIYKDHTLITKGIYNIIRHPLYASLIWIFYACSILYQNWLAFLLNTLIFLPSMYLRAKQEETLLLKEFKSYREYQKKVGMFFPKLKW